MKDATTGGGPDPYHYYDVRIDGVLIPRHTVLSVDVHAGSVQCSVYGGSDRPPRVETRTGTVTLTRRRQSQ